MYKLWSDISPYGDPRHINALTFNVHTAYMTLGIFLPIFADSSPHAAQFPKMKSVQSTSPRCHILCRYHSAMLWITGFYHECSTVYNLQHTAEDLQPHMPFLKIHDTWYLVRLRHADQQDSGSSCAFPNPVCRII